MSGPEIGCALSHRKVYKEIVDSGACGAVILEDDVIVPPIFLEALAWFRARGEGLAETCAMYHLGALSRPYACILILRQGKATRDSGKVGFAEVPICQPTEVLGTCGYFVTRAAARSLLASSRLEAVSDLWSTWARRAGAGLFVSVPAAVIHPHDPESSDIKMSRDAVINGRRAMKYRVYRLARYLYYGVRRRVLQFILKPTVEIFLR